MSNKMKNMRAMLFLFFMAASFNVFAQNVALTGNVIDALGEPIIGASILEKGTTNGTITDFDGNFSLSVSSKATIVVSYIGMKPQEIVLKGQTKLNVTLQDDAQALEEVVVIGYGTVKRKDLTGSVVTVGADALAAVPVANATEALQGKMAGVQITTTEGSPDATMSIRVRGGGSITQSNEPLFIVDGFPVEGISDISPSEIEDITVLKDASSTAIYGSRGANGVIIVTTKSGKEGKVNVSYNAYYAWKKVANTLDVLDAKDYAKWQYELAALKNKIPGNYEEHFGTFLDMDMYDNIATNDWQELTFGRIGHTFNQNLSINGGSDKMKYAFSYARIDDKAIMEMSNFVRDNLSLKLNHKLNKRISVDYSVRFSKTKVNGAGANDTEGAYNTDKRLRYAIQYTPFPVKGISDSGDGEASSSFYSPLASLRDNDQRKNRMQINMAGAFTWEVIDNLRFKTEIGYDIYRNDIKKYMGETTYYIQNVPKDSDQGKAAITLTKQNRTKIRNTNTLNYDFKKILGKDSRHHLNVLAGQEYVITKNELLTNTAHGFPLSFTAEDCWNLSSQGTPYEINDFYSPNDILFSFFGRANYDFDGKYLVSATFRADGSSKFGEGDRWGYFPSASAAWRISSEPFMESTRDWLDDLKLRASYGTSGNNNIPSGLLAQEYEPKTTSWINGYDSYWAPSKTMANPDLKWETTYTRNLGLDFSIMGGRITGTIEGYWNNTKDLLIQYPVGGTGYDFQYRNMGETENTGFEISANWVAVNKKNFGLTVGANISFNKNKVKSLGLIDSMDNISTSWASTEIDRDFVIKTGQPIGQMWGYVSDGRYEVSDFNIEESKAQGKWVLNKGVADASGIVGDLRPGLMKLKNIDGSEDDKITADDRQIIGDANPTHIGGFNLSARIYNFDIAANFNWSVGNDIYNANKLEYTQTSKYDYRNFITEMADGRRWTSINASGELLNWNNADELTALNANTTMWSPYTDRYIFSDYGVEDGSFLRLSTLTVGYSLPKTLLSKVGINSLRFYTTVYNVFCLTSYSGFDPEVSTVRKTNLTPGVDYSAYPKSRQFVVGLNLNF